MLNSSKDVCKTLVIPLRKSSGVCINVPEGAAENAKRLTERMTKSHQEPFPPKPHPSRLQALQPSYCKVPVRRGVSIQCGTLAEWQ